MNNVQSIAICGICCAVTWGIGTSPGNAQPRGEGEAADVLVRGELGDSARSLGGV